MPKLEFGPQGWWLQYLGCGAGFGFSLWWMFRDWDLVDVGYTFVGIMQGKRVKIMSKFNEKAIKSMFASVQKGDFLETNHAQRAWYPILSVESADGPVWASLKKAMAPILHHIDWQHRLDAITREVLAEAREVLDCAELCRVIAKILFELVTDRPLPDEAMGKIMLGVDAWKRDLAGKGVAELGPKLGLLEFMKDSVDAMEPKVYDKDDVYTMSAIMQPLFVSPLINLPDIFAVAERHLKELPEEIRHDVVTDAVVCEAFIKECMRVGHPFPLVERRETKGLLFSRQTVCRYDLFGRDGPPFDFSRWLGSTYEPLTPMTPASPSPKIKRNCPYESMLFGAGPRMCQGRELALKLMTDLLMHFGRNINAFNPSSGHACSGRTNDDNETWRENVSKVGVVGYTLYKTAFICAPLRMLGALTQRA